MSIEQVARQVIDCWESHNLNKVLGILTDDFVLTGPAPQPLPKEAYAVFQSVNVKIAERILKTIGIKIPRTSVLKSARSPLV